MNMLILKPEDRVRFNDTEMDVYHINGERWLLGGQIVTAMGQSETALKKLYKRHRSEFTSEMTAIMTVATSRGPRQARAFSPRGAALISMLTNSPKAAAFRTGVLDVLEGKAPPPLAGTPSPALPHQGGGGGIVAMNAAMADALRAEILKDRPLWRRIVQYRGMGLSHRDIAKLLDLDKSTIRVHVRRMEACGILTPPANLAALQGNVLNFHRLAKPEGDAHA